jgi:hypothetical protein
MVRRSVGIRSHKSLSENSRSAECDKGGGNEEFGERLSVKNKAGAWLQHSKNFTLLETRIPK